MSVVIVGYLSQDYYYYHYYLSGHNNEPHKKHTEYLTSSTFTPLGTF